MGRVIEPRKWILWLADAVRCAEGNTCPAECLGWTGTTGVIERGTQTRVAQEPGRPIGFLVNTPVRGPETNPRPVGVSELRADGSEEATRHEVPRSEGNEAKREEPMGVGVACSTGSR